MISRKTINLYMIGILGAGILIYYKIKGLLSGRLTIEQLIDQPLVILSGVLFGFGIATIAIVGYDWVVRFLRKQFPNKTEHGKRFLIQFTCSTLFSVSAVYVFGVFFYKYVALTSPPEHYILDLIIMGLFIPIVVNGVKESLYYYGEWESELLRKEQLQKENIQAQYEILKNQINPHFLFNCFSTLTDLTYENRDLAIQFIQQLSKVYRFVLENKDQDLVYLKNELSVLESYVFLMKIRFGDCLQVNIANKLCSSEYTIAPLTLQILLENALKHNIASSSKPLTITIDISNENKLLFKNNLQRKNSVSSTQIGIQNIVSRYYMIAQQTVDIVETPQEYIVKVPLMSGRAV